MPRPRSKPPDSANDFWRWMDENKVSVEAVANVLSVSASTVYGWRRGDRPPGRKMAARISKMTDGEVAADSWD